MYQVRSCDFCGEDAVGVFESMPPELDPGDAEQRRFALCADCRDRLQAVVEPYLERLQGETTDGGSATRTQSATDTTDSGVSTEATQQDQPSRSERSPSTVDGPSKQSPPRDDDVTVAEYVAEREETDEAAESGNAPDGAEEHEPSPRFPQSPSRGGHPTGYRKVVRLLSNRDGAMSRGDLRALATNAYDLDRDEFETAVDAALRTGDLAETSSGLRAP